MRGGVGESRHGGAEGQDGSGEGGGELHFGGWVVVVVWK